MKPTASGLGLISWRSAAGTRAVIEQRDLETVRAALGSRRFEALSQAGRELTVDDAVTLAGAIQTHGAHRS